MGPHLNRTTYWYIYIVIYYFIIFIKLQDNINMNNTKIHWSSMLTLVTLVTIESGQHSTHIPHFLAFDVTDFTTMMVAHVYPKNYIHTKIPLRCWSNNKNAAFNLPSRGDCHVWLNFSLCSLVGSTDDVFFRCYALAMFGQTGMSAYLGHIAPEKVQIVSSQLMTKTNSFLRVRWRTKGTEL